MEYQAILILTQIAFSFAIEISQKFLYFIYYFFYIFVQIGIEHNIDIRRDKKKKKIKIKRRNSVNFLLTMNWYFNRENGFN